jgi:hypothetical protein
MQREAKRNCGNSKLDFCFRALAIVGPALAATAVMRLRRKFRRGWVFAVTTRISP